MLTLYLVKRAAGGSPITIVCTAEGDDHRAAVAASVTAAWTVGDYSWSARVAKGAEKYSIENIRQQLVVLQNPETAANGFDGRTQAEKALTDARTALATWSPTTKRYKIGDREMEFSGRADIVGVVSFWEIQVKRERRSKALGEGRPDPAKTYVRLNRE